MKTRLDDKAFLEDKYATPDPWGYQTSPDDAERKRRIIAACCRGWSHLNAGYAAHDVPVQFERALDIGAGEGWITRDLPARMKYGYELSDRAAGRFPVTVHRVTSKNLVDDDFTCDLVVAAGVYYEHYDWRAMHLAALYCASGIVVTCHLEDSEIPLPCAEKMIHEERFAYRGRTQRLAVYDFSEVSK